MFPTRHVIAAIVAGLLLSACDQGGQNSAATFAPPAATGPDAAANFLITGYHTTNVQTYGGTITMRRSIADGNQGILFRRAPTATSAALLQFSVQGEDLLFRARVNDQTIMLPVAESNSIMIGPGGASEIMLYGAADPIILTVTGITDCASAAAGTCRPPSAPPQ
jgi:hypothetical protein